MLIMKFGGTSVGSAERMKAVTRLIPADERIVVVLSAMSGTTNALISLCDSLKNREEERAASIISDLKRKYAVEIDKLSLDSENKAALSSEIERHLRYLSSIQSGLFTPITENEVVALGEILSTAMFRTLTATLIDDSVLIAATDFMRIDRDGEPDFSAIEILLNQQLEQHPDKRVFITQGFICRNEFGHIDNLRRGGSDYTASIIGGILKAREIQIWTDIDGMHNNDPRVVDGTRPVHHLSFDEAAELAYFGAKILHPKTIHPARSSNVPVRLKNTMDPEAPGTIIDDASEGSGIKAIAAKDGITAIKIKSDRMLLAYGFLRRVFEVFEAYKTPIDMIATSEVAVSLTIDDDSRLNEIVENLSKFGHIEIDRQQTIICLVGDLVAESKGIASRVFSALGHVPIRMVSYGGSRHNISLLVSTEYKEEALRSLHNALFK